MDKKLITTCAKNLFLCSNEQDREITGLSLDSRLVQPGYAFLACIGTQRDGRDYVEQAIAAGASSIIYEIGLPEPQALIDAKLHYPQCSFIPVKHLSQKTGDFASAFYDHPSRQMHIFAVTGTNGKTSCCHYLAQMFQALGQDCGIIGTAGIGFLSELSESSLTTPDCVNLQQHLADFQQRGAASVALEASSHGLQQGRLQGVSIDTAILTNLTHDHLDYHGSFEQYAAAKTLLFQQPGLQQAVVNVDDAFGRNIVKQFQSMLEIVRYSIESPKADIVASQIQSNMEGLRAWIESPWGKGWLNTKILGQFNLSNLLAVIASFGLMGFSLKKILFSLSALTEVTGRMQVIGGDDQAWVIIDFAHTPDALTQVLRTLRSYRPKRLYCLFGCGGCRDQQKRRIMGEIVSQYSDVIYVSNDNPRHDDPEFIAEQIIAGIKKEVEVHIELDRQIAIKQVINQAQAGDIVLIAGKGHENVQVIGDKKYPFSDLEFAKKALSK